MRKITTSAYMPTEIEVVNVSENVAQIIAYPFEKGYGVTLAHPLRRLIYTSTVGYAPTAVKIEGVSHEFDSMRGMLEDVTLFIINLKNLRFKPKNSDTEREIIEYTFTGPKEIVGKDLGNNDLVDVVNPEAYLATINEDATLKFTIIVEKGIGYVPSEELRNNPLYKDYIILDAFFSPVKLAVYDIQNVRVDDNPDYEKVVFTITTDGQVTPVDAFKHSLESMYQQMSVFKKIFDLDTVCVPTSKTSELSKLLENINNLNLSARSFNSLEKAGIIYIGEIAIMDENELKNTKNLGKKSLDEIKKVMEEIGYPIGAFSNKTNKDALLKKIKELKAKKD